MIMMNSERDTHEKCWKWNSVRQGMEWNTMMMMIYRPNGIENWSSMHENTESRRFTYTSIFVLMIYFLVAMFHALPFSSLFFFSGLQERTNFSLTTSSRGKKKKNGNQKKGEWIREDEGWRKKGKLQRKQEKRERREKPSFKRSCRGMSIFKQRLDSDKLLHQALNYTKNRGDEGKRVS